MLKYFYIAILVLVLSLSGCTSKPSKEALKQSIKANAESGLGENPSETEKETVDAYAQCMADEIYNKLTTKTVKAFVDAKTSKEFEAVKSSKEEQKVLDDALTTCADRLVSRD